MNNRPALCLRLSVCLSVYPFVWLAGLSPSPVAHRTAAPRRPELGPPSTVCSSGPLRSASHSKALGQLIIVGGGGAGAPQHRRAVSARGLALTRPALPPQAHLLQARSHAHPAGSVTGLRLGRWMDI